MTGGGDQSEDGTITPAGVNRAGAQILEAIAAACDREADFPEKVEAGLGASLALFATKPELICPLTEPLVEEGAQEQQRRFLDICAARLRAAAQAGGLPVGPPLAEPFLLRAVGFQISRARQQGETDLLPSQLPELCDFVLAYYRGTPTGDGT